MKGSSGITTTPLEHLATQIREKEITDNEAYKKDITNLYWEDNMVRIQSNELINQQVRGLGSTGKSTVAASIIWELNSRKDMLARKDLLEKFAKLIVSDQVEFTRFRKMGLKRLAIMIDEYNRMGETGLSATTEKAISQQYSDIFTQNFVHRIGCTPSGIIDPNASIILDVKGRNLETGKTRLKVRYRDITEGGTPIVIGRMDVDVSAVMKMKWYQDYRKKKFKRMDLMEKSGIRDIRDPEFSIITLSTFEELKELAAIKRVQRVLIKGKVDEVLRKEGLIYSILAVEEIAGRASILLDLLNSMSKEKEVSKHGKTAAIKGKAKKAYNIMEKTYLDRLKQEKEWAKIYKEYLEM